MTSFLWFAEWLGVLQGRANSIPCACSSPVSKLIEVEGGWKVGLDLMSNGPLEAGMMLTNWTCKKEN